MFSSQRLRNHSFEILTAGSKTSWWAEFQYLSVWSVCAQSVFTREIRQLILPAAWSVHFGLSSYSLKSIMPANTCDTDATTPFWATSTPLVCVSNLNKPNTKIEFLMFSVTLCEQLQPTRHKNWVSHFSGRITKKPFSIQVSCFVKTPRPQIAIKLRPNLCPAETLDQVSPPVFHNWALNWPDFRH